MMATYFIYAFFGMYFQGLTALQFSSVALIYPQRTDITVDAGTNLTLGCRGTEAMNWTFNDPVNGPHFNNSQKKIIYIYNDKELDYKHETILTVYNVSYVNVGFYYCYGGTVDIDTPRRSSRIYVFVHDASNLSVLTSQVYHLTWNEWRTLIPCRPTAPDINITLACVGGLIMSMNPSSYTTVYQNELFVIRFNSYDGFIMENRRPSIIYGRCSCIFKRNNKLFTIHLDRNLIPQIYNKVSIEGSATADVYGNITLQCTYLAGQYFPYDKHWLHWLSPINVNKYTENLQVIKMKIYVLLINTITMSNISTENEGDYKCQLDSRFNVDSDSKYIYVNDKRSKHSALWINSTNGSEYQVNSGANIILRCAGFRPVTWTRTIPKRLYYEIEHVSNSDGIYETYLHLTDVRYIDTGAYHCYEKDFSTKHTFHSKTIYMFVKDKRNLYVLDVKTEIVEPYSNVTVPCLPTSRDVNVSIDILHQARDLDDLSYGPEQNITPVKYAYNSWEGITVQMPGPGLAFAICKFTTETATKIAPDINYIIRSVVAQSEPLVTGPHEDLVFVGQTLELSCTVFVYYNFYDDELRWTRPNHFASREVIEEIKRINIRQGKILIKKLILHDVKDADKGRYFCNTTSYNASASKVISVYDQFSVVPVIQNLTYDYAYIGQPLVLRCKVDVDHNDDFEMSWTTPNGTETKNKNIEYIRVIQNTSGEIFLKIDNITQVNEGNYSCNVFYPGNRRNYTTKHIMAKKGRKPKIVTSNFKEKVEIDVLLDETIYLTCFAEGDPKPVIIWMKDSTKVERLGQHIGFASNKSELTIHYVQMVDAGQYTCIAQNPFGEDSCTVDIRLKTVSLILYYAIIFLLIFMIITMAAFLAKRTYKQKKLRKKLGELGFIKFKSGEVQRLNPLRCIAEQAALLFYDTKWEIPRNSIELGCNLGSGYFGLVVKAIVSNFFDGEPEKSVAVKMLHPNCNIIELNSFICELKIMSHLEEHVNLINLLGACTERIAEGNLLVIIEYCEHGSLRNYLREIRSNFVNLIDPDTELICLPDVDNVSLQDAACRDSGGVSTLQLLRWALQVAYGMEFLASKQILHGDLALRNVLLNENYVVKISDYGLSKNLSSSGYYTKTTACPLPIKWMAIESIRSKTFSTQSDVWAFGVVLWEFFTLARTPYAELEPDFRFYRKLESGYRLERPEYSTREIYQMMLECWREQPQNRPTFSCLARTLTDLLQEPNKRLFAEYVSPDAHSAAASKLVANQADHTAALDWIALNILPVDDTTTTRF